MKLQHSSYFGRSQSRFSVYTLMSFFVLQCLWSIVLLMASKQMDNSSIKWRLAVEICCVRQLGFKTVYRHIDNFAEQQQRYYEDSWLCSLTRKWVCSETRAGPLKWVKSTGNYWIYEKKPQKSILIFCC